MLLFLRLKAIQQAMEIFWGQFPIGIPVHCRRQEVGLVLIHLWLLPEIQDGEGCLLLDVDRSTLWWKTL